jgi:hypothetical protein
VCLVYTILEEGFAWISLKESCAIGIRVLSELDANTITFLDRLFIRHICLLI